MKLTLIILLFACTVVKGQTGTTLETLTLPSIGSAFSKNTIETQPASYFDTIRVFMLMADTASRPKDKWYVAYESKVIMFTWTDVGYEIRKFDYQLTQHYPPSVNGTTLAIYISPTWEPYPSHYAYLDDKKQPLKYLVWLSKPIQ